jgi:hypothetical protein
MLVELRLVYDPSDPEEAAAMADPLASIMGWLAQHGVATAVRSPVGDIVANIPASALVPAETKPARTRASRGNGKAAAAKEVPAAQADETDAVAEAEPEAATAEAEAAPAPALDEDPFSDSNPVPAPERSPEEAKARALALLRHVYTRPGGGADAVKKLQKVHKVTKFADVPVKDGLGLLVEAERLARDFSVSLPG